MYLGPPPRGFQKGGGVGKQQKKMYPLLAQTPPQKKKDRAKIRPPYASTFFFENVLEGVPPPSVHFLAGG